MKDLKYRYEWKYLCNIRQIEEIKNRLKYIVPLDKHTENGQYCIRSMYFDNLDNRCYYENENGIDPREKFRIRIYNAKSDRIVLECKRKERGKTYKSSCLLKEDEYRAILDGGSVDNIGEKHPLFRKFYVLQKSQLFKPVVIVEYDRTPYVYRVGNVRITLDMNIRSSNEVAHFFDENISTRPVLQSGQHLLEVKYDELLPDFIKDILQIDGLQRSAFSKYYLCRKFSMEGLL
ncbi:MAG: polyphosphate polymerase domain-containing protein [Ruminococcaceae bacterium]|nr:polyphosphate polymerase domain-containing protein [Oscillospiraceae bacterium]